MEINFPEKIFVAGKYSPRECTLNEAVRQTQRNVDQAIEIGNKLIEMGHYVFVPHVHSHYMQIHHSYVQDVGIWWYAEDETFLKHWATSLFFISHSPGSSSELLLANEMKLKIYFDLSEVPNLKLIKRREN